MTKIEEVALALCRDGCATMPSTSCREKCRAFDDPPTKPGGEYFSSRRQMYLREARAAIEAMREPTEAMFVSYPVMIGEPPAERMKACWQAMIDAALNEEVAERDTEEQGTRHRVE